MERQSTIERAAEKAMNSYYHLCAQLAFQFKEPDLFPDSLNKAMDELEKNLDVVRQLAKGHTLNKWWNRLKWKKPL